MRRTFLLVLVAASVSGCGATAPGPSGPEVGAVSAAITAGGPQTDPGGATRIGCAGLAPVAGPITVEEDGTGLVTVRANGVAICRDSFDSAVAAGMMGAHRETRGQMGPANSDPMPADGDPQDPDGKDGTPGGGGTGGTTGTGGSGGGSGGGKSGSDPMPATGK